MLPERIRQKDTTRTQPRVSTSFSNNLFNQPILGFILLLEPHHKPVKDETGTKRSQSESY
jgi:hypothetical protein